jgi:pentatricopeptide repeat protein
MEKLRVLSATLAEIYMRQGHFEKARDVYRQLLAREADNSVYRSRLALLVSDSPGRRKLHLLTRLLKKIEEKRDEREAV